MINFCQRVRWLAAALLLLPLVAFADRPAPEVDISKANIARIRQIVLSRAEGPAAVAHLIQLARELEAADAARLFSQIADDYLRTGQLNKAAEVLRQLIDQYPDQPAAADGLLTLVQLYSSSEVAHSQQISFASTDGESTSIYALHLAAQTISKNVKFRQPALEFQCSVAARRAGREKSARRWLTPLKHNSRIPGWRACALAEDWLVGGRSGASPKQIRFCVRADERPKLDGILDEPIWSQEKPHSLSSSTPSAEMQLYLAYDNEFFYLALRCTKLPDMSYAADSQPRAYDANFAGQDHVTLRIDVDRDYATYFQFAVDHRGQTSDSCWHDTTWNPRWFVAAGGDVDAWTIEAAIPLSELTARSPQPGDAWALAVERQATPSESAPESFELLLFR